MNLQLQLGAARAAAEQVRLLPAAVRDRALLFLADDLAAHERDILDANATDLKAHPELGAALLDRLRLTPARIGAMAKALREVAAQPDPLAEIKAVGTGPSGIRVTRRRVPLGVIAIVYEARPNVTVECAALALKSGNAIVLRGGKEAWNSNQMLASLARAAFAKAGAPEDAVVLADCERATVSALLAATGQIDLLIPRGGKALMALVDKEARVPVIRHGEGICHVFVDAAADLERAQAISLNSKVQRPGVCNAMETLLVHQQIAGDFLPGVAQAMLEAGVELRADERAASIFKANDVPFLPATEDDWSTEYLRLVLAIRVVDTLEAALGHIARYGSHHTASIVTEDSAAAERFLAQVDASCVLWNASTRFNDGGELGLGAELGISTSKVHAYGPMSAVDLTAEKLVVYGAGQIRQ